MAEPKSGGFWTSLPGLIVAITGLVAALTAAWVAIRPKPVDPVQSVPAVVNGTDPAPIAEAPPVNAGSTQPLPQGANLIATASGGKLVLSGSANWDKMIDGDEDIGAQIGEHVNDFGVFAFRDGKSARIDAVTATIPGANPGNPTAIEVSYATASADGPFASLGVFPVRNALVPPDGRQVFHFAPVDARFVKIIVRPTRSGGPYVMAYEFGVRGSLR